MPPSPVGSGPGLTVAIAYPPSGPVADRPKPRKPATADVDRSARIVRMGEATVRVGLPRLDERVGQAVAVAVEHAPGDHDAAGGVRRHHVRAVRPRQDQVAGTDRPSVTVSAPASGQSSCGSSIGVAARPRSTMSNAKPSAQSGRVASQSKREISRSRAGRAASTGRSGRRAAAGRPGNTSASRAAA